MAQDALVTVTLRNEFYRDNSRRVMLVLLLSIILNIAMGGLLFYLINNPPAPRYFATSIDGRITPLFPLDKPNQSDSAVLQWANIAAIASFTYDFVNYRTQLQAASDFFTPKGWTQFLRALESSNNLDAVRSKKLNVSAVATSAPIILRKGLVGGRFALRVRMPLLVTYQSASTYQQERYLITMLITRVSTLNSPRGIGIEQFVAQPAGGL